MTIKLNWSNFKTQIVQGGLPYRYLSIDNTYYIFAADGPFQYETFIIQDSNEDQIDFENNFKNTAFSTFSQFDTDGAHIVRNKAAKKGWTFCSLPFEFETARLSDTLFCQDYLGNNRTFVTMKAYDNNNVEVTTPGLAGINYASIVKTVIDFEPPYDFEIIGGDLRTLTSISADMRLWIIAVPDLPAPTGSKEMGGGINLKYLSPGNVWSVDGRVTKYATYNATYHTNKIRLILKYPAGTNENLSVVVQLYKA